MMPAMLVDRAFTFDSAVSASSRELPIERARSSAIGVGWIPRAVRMKRGRSMSASRVRICALTPGWLVPSRLAAADSDASR